MSNTRVQTILNLLQRQPPQPQQPPPPPPPSKIILRSVTHSINDDEIEKGRCGEKGKREKITVIENYKNGNGKRCKKFDPRYSYGLNSFIRIFFDLFYGAKNGIFRKFYGIVHVKTETEKVLFSNGQTIS
ncbi:hypothetical protein Phum_PHUM598160 [Pediculus humanus corporis]|uniref:Uncharacterized protein n=1 Tax=Pediculus humanus subsp. corporis TaxID=121224 RepID=E0W2W4_PEDHC|nr:uncharacterized protein Phum_PHUM598160 [Pediculus humanus corporis]EEB19970.1 hypothetical protein Phum_PHUM598160 [Pediculus humanus corporis]